MTPKEEIKRKSFFGFQSFWIQFFLILKSVLYRGFFKGIIERLYAKTPALYRNLRYRLTLYWGKINWKIKGFIWWSEKNCFIWKGITVYQIEKILICLNNKGQIQNILLGIWAFLDYITQSRSLCWALLNLPQCWLI